jgi:hypothetical protein
MLDRDLARGSTEGFTEAALSSSPEGLRTPDLFRERDELEISGEANRAERGLP